MMLEKIECNKLNELSKESLIEINGGAIPPWVVRYGPTAAAIAWERAVELYNDWDAIVEAFWEGWEAGKAAME